MQRGTTSTVLLAILISCGVATACRASTLYVDANAAGANDGSSWCDAFVALQDALAVAAAADGSINEIRVAQGVYKPDGGVGQTPGDRAATFHLLDGVALKGGYAGCGATDPDERDPAQFVSTLSGDLNGDDGPGPFDGNSENAFHVVTGSERYDTAIIDGFTITAGNAHGAFPDNEGGGMLNNVGNPTVTGCTFADNTAVNGAGMMNRGGSVPTITASTFVGNSADNDGGGIYNASSDPIVNNCAFLGNKATEGGTSYGGGMANYTASPSVTDCAFVGNSAGTSGGGMSNRERSYPTVRSCTFKGNTASSGGGGMCNLDLSSPAVINCIFTGNEGGTSGGGGMWNGIDSSPRVTNCLFTGNESLDESGGGGGMRNEVRSHPIVTNCTFYANLASIGGGMRSNDDCNPTVENCVFWQNVPDQIDDLAASVTTATYSCIQGGWPGLGNIDEDPLFVDPIGPDGIPGTEDDDLRLSPGSPCIDVGDNTVVDACLPDLDRNWRIVDGDGDEIPVVDMGPYEFGSTPLEECDDGALCTVDSCDPAIGCVYEALPAGTACGDPTDTDCDNPDTCDGFGHCVQNYEPDGFACGDPNDTDCDNPDTCDGTGQCLQNMEPDGAACGDPADTDCDHPDTCNGAGACLPNFEPAGTSCGDPATGECDGADSCDGLGSCLANNEPVGTPCGDPTDTDCDNPDTCDVAGTCLPNYEPPGTPCNDGEPCTLDDECQGDTPGTCAGEYVDADVDAVCDPLDNCRLYNPDQADCDENDIGDVCDIADHGRPRAEGRFDLAGTIVSCTSDDDCLVGLNPESQVYCVHPPNDPEGEGICYIQKNRYISIDPTPVAACALTARRVTLDVNGNGVYEPGIDVVIGWVGEPMELAITGPEPSPQLLARIVAEAAAHYRDWTRQHNGEPWVDPTVQVGDCEVSPGHTYFVQAIEQGADLADEASYSEVVVLKTTTLFGDVTGGAAGTPPDNICNFKDITAVVQAFQGDQRIPKVWCDLQGGTQTPEIPDFSNISFGDIGLAVGCFQGEVYPFPQPCECPGQACP